jgi:hypothetical protein
MMAPSQLRRLALEHAGGLLDTQAYHQQRRVLIDAIVNGEIRIVREPLRAPGQEETGLRPSASRRLLVIAGIAATLLLLVALLQRSDTGDAPPASMPREVAAPRSTVTPARSLVESFLARRDFSAAALARFEQAWEALPGADHRLARGENWFQSLGVTLQAQRRAQLALAELGGDTGAQERSERLLRFGQRIGVPMPAGSASAPGAAPRSDPAPTQSPLEWLGMQPASNVTLQLFAVNGLDHVGQFIASYPRLDLHVLDSERAPRFRVVLGSFAEVAQAREAFDALPAPVRDAAGEAIVKSISALREDLRPAAPAAVVRPPGYAVQLFATANRERARALVEAHPGLALQVVEAPDSPAPHRVVMGPYPDIDAARNARAALPADLLERVGEPLIKRRDRLGQVQR